jgi:hypothetical protein
VRQADLLADEQHRRFVTLSFADDDRSVDRDVVHAGAHRLDGRVIGSVAVTLPHRVRARDRRLLDNAEELEREVARHVLDAASVARCGGSSQRVGRSAR